MVLAAATGGYTTRVHFQLYDGTITNTFGPDGKSWALFKTQITTALMSGS